MYLLDTDHVSLLARVTSTESQNLRLRMDAFAEDGIRTSVVTFEEQTRGWLAYSARARTVAQVVEVYKRLLDHLDVYRKIEVVPFDDRAAVEYQRLLSLRLRVGTMDLRIAAVALAQGAILLSRNIRDFGKISGLVVEDWTA